MKKKQKRQLNTHAENPQADRWRIPAHQQKTCSYTHIQKQKLRRCAHTHRCRAKTDRHVLILRWSRSTRQLYTTTLLILSSETFLNIIFHILTIFFSHHIINMTKFNYYTSRTSMFNLLLLIESIHFHYSIILV